MKNPVKPIGQPCGAEFCQLLFTLTIRQNGKLETLQGGKGLHHFRENRPSLSVRTVVDCEGGVQLVGNQLTASFAEQVKHSGPALFLHRKLTAQV
jgi:hypothetical protein